MTMRRVLWTALLMSLLTSVAAATELAQPNTRVAPQPKRPTAAPPEAPPPPPPPPPGGDARARPAKTGQPINIKVEFTITDQRGGATPVKRTISVVVADSYTGYIRSQSDIAGFNTNVPLNVDTSPNLLADGKIRLGFNLQYDSPLPVQSSEGGTPRGTVLKTAMHDSVMLILENGKSVIAAQSADPIGDRQVTVEVKATVLK
jgi:opacity protein-like surface antigen